MDKEVKNYEIAFLVKSEEEQKKLFKILTDFQLTIINEGKLSKIKLAYPIKKQNFAYFGYLYFSGASDVVNNLTKFLNNEPSILRFIIISQPVIEKEKTLEKDSATKKTSGKQTTKTTTISKKNVPIETLSNEALEKKLEEILK
jgi:ribosomal protein S6